MRVQCDRCGSSYTLPEERVAPGRRLQFQCRHCQNRIVVAVPEVVRADVETAPEPAVRAMAAPAVAAGAPPASRVLWFVSSPAGQQQRMDTEGVRAAIGDGTVTRDNWVWKKGLAEWLRAGDCADFAPYFAPAAPPEMPQPTLESPAAQEPEPTLSGSVVELSRPAVVSGSHIAGTASVHKGAGHNTDQRAVAMPIIRADEAGHVEPVRKDNAPRRTTSLPRPPERPAGQRRETRNEGSLLRVHGDERELATATWDTVSGEEDPSKGKWSPATDTYTGPKARLTRKVDDRDRNVAVEWAEAMGRKDAERDLLLGQVRAWQRLAIAAVSAMGIILLVALLMTWKWREADLALSAALRATQQEPHDGRGEALKIPSKQDAGRP